MASFLFLPHTSFVAKYGLEHFEPSMRAQHELTQRFTAEFSIRPFIERHPDATMARLTEWTADPSPHVRRLVSEGTRPRLPWAPRLRAFQADPRPVLALLERLKDDPELYVRRSVANSLNDIGKDHPSILVETATRWMGDASAERKWIVRHSLRSSVKRADTDSLRILGYEKSDSISLESAEVAPARLARGDSVTIRFEVANSGSEPCSLLVDYRVHYAKAGGRTGAKVFKLRSVLLAPGESTVFEKRLSLVDRTTRKHHPGLHRVEALLNGRAEPLGSFELV